MRLGSWEDLAKSYADEVAKGDSRHKEVLDKIGELNTQIVVTDAKASKNEKEIERMRAARASSHDVDEDPDEELTDAGMHVRVPVRRYRKTRASLRELSEALGRESDADKVARLRGGAAKVAGSVAKDVAKFLIMAAIMWGGYHVTQAVRGSSSASAVATQHEPR